MYLIPSATSPVKAPGKNLDKFKDISYNQDRLLTAWEYIMDQVQPKIGVEYTENATIATLTDEQILDQAEVQALENSIMPLVEEAGAINLVIDFGNVKFLTSAVLGLLIRVSKKIYESGGHLKLCGINPKILEIFKITRLDRIFDIYDDRQDATAKNDL